MQDKVIVVTGAFSGIGAGAAITSAELGAGVILLARREERLREIVITSSKAGIYSFAGGVVYYGAKSAVRSITDTLQQEEGENNIRTTTISLRTVNTGLHNTISDPARRDWTLEIQKGIGLTFERMNVNEVFITPTKSPVESFEWK